MRPVQEQRSEAHRVHVANALRDHHGFAVLARAATVVMARGGLRVRVVIVRLVVLVGSMRDAVVLLFFVTNRTTRRAGRGNATATGAEDVAKQHRERRKAGDDVATRKTQGTSDAMKRSRDGQRRNLHVYIGCAPLSPVSVALYLGSRRPPHGGRRNLHAANAAFQKLLPLARPFLK